MSKEPRDNVPTSSSPLSALAGNTGFERPNGDGGIALGLALFSNMDLSDDTGFCKVIRSVLLDAQLLYLQLTMGAPSVPSSGGGSMIYEISSSDPTPMNLYFVAEIQQAALVNQFHV